jgi:cyclase
VLRKRLIPLLQILDGSLVKTCRFRDPVYLGDPTNSSRIFNELYADELIVMDISESRSKRFNSIDFNLLESLASECFMPITYGGKIKCVEDATKVVRLGIEKISINSGALETPKLISEISDELGASSTVISIDLKYSKLKDKFFVFSNAGKKGTGLEAVEWIEKCIQLGAGEILLTDINREGTWLGMHHKFVELAQRVTEIPIILAGGTSSYAEAASILEQDFVSGIGLGNLVSFQKKDSGVLINYPKEGIIQVRS